MVRPIYCYLTVHALACSLFFEVGTMDSVHNGKWIKVQLKYLKITEKPMCMYTTSLVQ